MPRTEELEIRLVSLEEKIEEMMERVSEVLRISFGEITNGREKSEIIVLFLALLHLLKESAVEIEQEGLFSEIHILRNNG